MLTGILAFPVREMNQREVKVIVHYSLTLCEPGVLEMNISTGMM
jgi:hypothetical protein